MPRVAVPTSKTKCVREKNRFMLEESKVVVDKVDEDVHSINS